MNKSKVIVPIMLFAIAFGVCGYTKANSDIDPVEVIRRLNGSRVKLETPTNEAKPVPVSSPIPSKSPITLPGYSPSNVPTKPVAVTSPGGQTTYVSPQPDNKGYTETSPLYIVKNPSLYIGKKVKFKAKFDKFSTLGLDYPAVMRSSEKYITLLIQRPDVLSHDIPLSELKIFMDRKSAEKYIDLNSGDEIEIAGKVFSRVLGDAWMDVDNFTVLRSVPKTSNK